MIVLEFKLYAKKPGKKGNPKFQKDCRSVEYKQTGWKLDEVRRRITFLDGIGAGTCKLKGTRDLLGYALSAIKRVRIVRRNVPACWLARSVLNRSA
jgi:putative transposase